MVRITVNNISTTEDMALENAKERYLTRQVQVFKFATL